MGVSPQLECGVESVRSWSRKADIEEGVRRGVSSDLSAEIRWGGEELSERGPGRSGGLLRGGGRRATSDALGFMLTDKGGSVVGRKLAFELLGKAVTVALTIYGQARARIPLARVVSYSSVRGRTFRPTASRN